MAMNPEQLTARINDLVDENRGIQQELARRAMEHQGQHSTLANLQAKLTSFEESSRTLHGMPETREQD